MQDSEDLRLPQYVVAAGELLGDGHQIDGHYGGARGRHENLRCVWRRWLRYHVGIIDGQEARA
jgi:hypothetical protein